MEFWKRPGGSVHRATYVETRTFQNAADTGPLVKKLTHYPTARDVYKEGKRRNDCKR